MRSTHYVKVFLERLELGFRSIHFSSRSIYQLASLARGLLIERAGNTKGGSITVPLTSRVTGLD
jgi:hypothetical protein